jgi:hypothetical protein
MIKMKRLIRSLVIASGGLLIAATASNAASISFAPEGTQLDTDEIFDIEVAKDDLIDFNVSVNPQSSSSVDIYFSIRLDTNELKLVWNDKTRPIGFEETAKGFNIRTVIAPNMMSMTNFQVKVLSGVISNGIDDVLLQLESASIGGQDVKGSFKPVTQEVEVQPVPEPTTIFGSALALGVGGWLKRKKSSQQNKTTPH